MNRMKFLQSAVGWVRRKRTVEQLLQFKNTFHVQHIRNGKTHGIYVAYNDVTIVGKNHVLDVVFGNSSPITQIATWYIGLINQSPTPSLSENDTLASHAGWVEFTAYSGNRQAWDDANAASKVKGSTTASEFTMSGAGTLHGLIIASVASGTSGVLFSTAPFDATVDVQISDEFRVTYGLRL